MDRSTLIENLNTFKDDLADAKRRVGLAQAEVDALEKIVEGIEGLAGRRDQPLPTSMDGAEKKARYTGPRGLQSLRMLFREDPSKTWSPDELTQELQRRGWMDPNVKYPAKSVGTSVIRLLNDHDEIVRVGRARYQLRRPSETTPDDQSEAPHRWTAPLPDVEPIPAPE